MRFCKKIFLIKAKNKNKIFCTACLKSAVREWKQNFSRKKISWGYLQGWEKSRNFRYGSSEDFF